MELCYDGALVMPSNYAVMDEEEMTYVDGGWCIENMWWGSNFYLTHKEMKLISLTGSLSGLTGLSKVATKFPGLAAAGIITAVAAGGLSYYDNGHGIRIRITGLKTSVAIITGIYSLSAAKERGIASLNCVVY